MKKWIIGAALMMTSIVAAAQHDRTKATPEEQAQKATDRMATELGLSEDQKKEIYALQLDNAKRRHAEEEKRKAEHEQRMQEMKDYDSKIKAVLNEEQNLKWEELKSDYRSKRRPGGEVHRRESLDYPGRGGRGGR